MRVEVFFRAKKTGASLPLAPAFVTWNCSGNSFFHFVESTRGFDSLGSAFAGDSAFAAWDAQALTAFPEALAADAQFASQFGLGHVVLVFEDEMLEVVFQRQVFGWLVAGAA